MTTSEFMKLYLPLRELLFAFSLRLTKNKEDAKDLCQETLFRAFKSREKFRKGTNFKAWITTILRNNYINEYRRRRSRHQVEQPLEEIQGYLVKKPVANEAESKMMLKELQKIFQSIGEKHRVPFELFFKGYEYKEIAKGLDLPIGTVKSRIFFARCKMKDLIQNYYGNLRPAHA